jgi:hypothetical protein
VGIDLVVSILLLNQPEFPDFLLIVLSLVITLVILGLAYKIWKVILTEESKVTIRNKNTLLIATVLTIFSGLIGLFIYLAEIILSSGVLGTKYVSVESLFNQDIVGIDLFLMVLVLIMRYLHNFFSIVGVLIIGVLWTRQFRVWARFSESVSVKSFYFAGVAMIILFFDQLITITLRYYLFWVYPNTLLEDYPVFFQGSIMVLFLIAALLLPVYIYFLTIAGQTLQVPHETLQPKSRKLTFFPFIFLFIWYFLTLAYVGGDTGIGALIQLLGLIFLVAAYIPIAIGFSGFAKNVNSQYLRRNLQLASIASLTLSTFTIVAPAQNTGMAILVGYLVMFSVLTWSLGNISQYLGSRQALSERLRKAGVQFLSVMGEAEMKSQSLQQMAKVMTDVSKGFMEDLARMDVSTPPTNEEIRRYIISTMGVDASPSESEIMAYLQNAISFVQQTGSK